MNASAPAETTALNAKKARSWAGAGAGAGNPAISRAF